MRPATVLLIASLLACGPAAGAAAQEAEAAGDSLAAYDGSQSGSWLSRTLKRYFAGSGQAGDDLQGQAVELVDSYEAFIGKTIEVVIVHQVARFDPYWDAGQGSTQQFLNSVTKPFHSYTKDRLIREYLLFEQGQPLDPFLLADSERMLRQLDFINDARIILVPLMGKDEDSVVVIVETRDRWPFGITGSIKDPDRYDVNLYFSNLGGYGVRLDNKMIYRGDMEPELGYQGRLRKENIRGSFVDMFLLYEDSWRVLSRIGSLQRTLIHPSIKWVGGGSWEYTDDRDNEDIPKKYQLGDYWAGYAIPLIKARSTEQSARPLLIPAVRFRKIDYLDRPYATPDTNKAYLNTRDYLAGVTYQRFKYFKTSYLFKLGETEDVPGGFTAKLSGGYQDREGYDRSSGFIQLAYSSVRPQGSITIASGNLGGYFHDYEVEDGALHLAGAHFTRLMGGGSYRYRFYGSLAYTLAYNRDGEENLVLGNATGLRGLADNQVKGNQRLLLKLESRVFTPWSMMGFRFMFYGFGDVGTVGGDNDQIAEQKVYSSIGLGFRFNNPDSVLPETQFRVGFVNDIEGSGFNLGFKVGAAENPAINMPGPVPGGFLLR